ncbi:MAG: DUF1273 domain-containing protein [Ruminococcus sp.]|nr:DUF1273 domain-containing protein [Ruminococcus sp.]
MSRSACFTGHREIAENPKKLSERLYNVLEKLVAEEGIIDYYAGGACGFDTIAALDVLKLRSKYSEVKLHLVLPCSNEEQTRNWTPTQKYDFKNVLSREDSIEYTSERFFKGCMGKRNARLVECAADYCICYYDEQKKGGTAQTVRMSKDKGLTVINLFEKK